MTSYTNAQVSIHAPAKGATNFCDCKRAGWQVSIHAPAKGATVWSIIIRSYRIMFQSTLPRRERLKLISREWKRWQFQSTLPRRERHDKLIQVNILTNVSIHVPAKGVTIRRYQKERVKKFQSTLPRRERPGAGSKATPCTAFQSTLPRRERRRMRKRQGKGSEFQSTLPRRERPI